MAMSNPTGTLLKMGRNSRSSLESIVGSSTMLEYNIPFYYSRRIAFTLAIKRSLVSEDFQYHSHRFAISFLIFNFLELIISPLFSHGGKCRIKDKDETVLATYKKILKVQTRVQKQSDTLKRRVSFEIDTDERAIKKLQASGKELQRIHADIEEPQAQASRTAPTPDL